MRRYGSTDPSPSDDLDQLAALPRRVIVKFRDQQEQQPAMVAGLDASVPDLVSRVRGAFPDYSVVPVVTSVEPTELDRMYRDAVAAGAPSRMGNLRSFIAIEVPGDGDPDAIIARATDLSGAESAYLEPRPAPPPVHPEDDPRFSNQGYLYPAPGGIDARFAWGKPGGDGAGIGLVDLEQGWRLDHEDLVAQNIQLISGSNALYAFHGTAVLGELCMSDNKLGGVGIVPSATVRVVSQHQPGGYSTAGAIASAVASMSSGDVLLLEAQSTWHGMLHPVEIDAAVFSAIVQAVKRGIVVVEAAANGTPNGMAPGLDLDTATDAAGKFVLNRNHADFQDSGAIIVGAASSAAPHTRMGFSNYGSRVDCFAWGENIDTTDTTAAKPTTAYRPDAATGQSGFSGTSGASPMVAGSAVALQGMIVASGRARLAPDVVRSVLSDSSNTPSANPAADRIGVMPDLHAIWDACVGMRSAPGDYPTPRSDVAYAGGGARVCLDAAHGGTENRGKSAALGSGAEKEQNLRLAQSVRRHLGGAALTRDGDYNLSLAERAARARESGAPIFVSLHGGADAARVWVYGGSGQDAHSRALAEAVRDELALLGRPADLRSGELAVLHPAYHRPGTAACLVETPRNAPHVDAMAAAIARGVRRYLGA